MGRCGSAALILQMLICLEGQKVRQPIGGGDLGKQVGGLAVTAGGERRFAHGGLDLVHLVGQHGLKQVAVDGAAVVKASVRMMDPLPQLGARDFGRGRIFHEVVQGHAAQTGEPVGHVLDTDVDVGAHARLGDRARRQLQQVGGRHMHVFAFAVDLVGRRHGLVELGQGHRHQPGMGHPGAVMAVGGLAGLVGTHLFQGFAVFLRIGLDGNLGGHAADGMGPTAVTGLDGQKRVGMHAVAGHGDLGAVGKQITGNVLEAFNETEDVIPASAVEPGAVFPQLKEDFIHFKGRQDGFDQHRGLDCAPGNSQGFLGGDEDVVPQACFQVALHFGQVEVGAAAALQECLGVVEEKEAEIEQAARDRLPVHADMFFHQVPAAWPDDQGGDGVVQAVGLAVRVDEFNRAPHGVPQVDLTFDEIGPGGAVAVLEIGHVGPGAGVEGIDHHLAVHRPGDFHATVLKVGRYRRHPPVAFAHAAGLG
ncbi:hypothetical protein DESC_320054 [Desulfosarcina cetonica]|nr:hypothetical protein DESC_320054 [Desulfosarcina cetonica]